MGEQGSVRELCDLGDRTLLGFAFAVREAARAAPVVAVAVRLGFFGLESRSGWTVGSFSLSDSMTISELRLFMPFFVGVFASLMCLTGEDGVGLGIGGKGWLLSATGTSGIALVELNACGISFTTGASAYLARSSPIVAFLRLIGIRLTRRSIRERRSVA